MFLCGCHCPLLANAFQACDSLQSMWRLYKRVQILCLLANLAVASSTVTAKDSFQTELV